MKLFNSLLIASFTLVSLDSYAIMRALNTAATGMAAQEANVSTISNNIANVNTVGFKKSRAEFEDLMYETVTEAGGRTSGNTQYNVGTQIGSGSKLSATRKVFTQGAVNITNNPFDLAIVNGEGFFGVQQNDGSLAFTRDGAFNVDATGTLVTKHGQTVSPGIQFPPNTKSVNITEDGMVEAFLNGQTEPQVLGQIPVYTFVNPVGLKSMGRNLYRTTRASGASIQGIGGQENSGIVMQGQLEGSNVNIMTEMTGLIKAQRALELNSKVLKSADEMLQTINNIR